MRSILHCLLSLACLCGCAEARLRPGGVEAAAGPVETKFKDLNSGQRRDAYARYRLTWDGRHVNAGGEHRLDREGLIKFLEGSGAPDLAAVASKAEPAWVLERNAKQRSGAGGDPRHSGGGWDTPWSGNADAQTAAAFLAMGAVVAVAAGAIVAGKAVVEGVWSDLNPDPTMEDVLEAYNQRLAYALGLDYRQAAVYTSRPPRQGKPSFTARGQRHGEYLVRGSLGASLAGMGIASAAALIEASQKRDAPPWAGPAFFASLGAGAASLVLGWTIVW